MEEIKVNLENLTGEEREKLMALIEKANSPKSKVWNPKKGETYYYMSERGEVYYSLWSNDAVDVGVYEIGNCFMTNEEANEEAKRLKILTQLKRLSVEAGENENPWDGDHEHWYCYYNFSTGIFREDFKYS